MLVELYMLLHLMGNNSNTLVDFHDPTGSNSRSQIDTVIRIGRLLF